MLFKIDFFSTQPLNVSLHLFLVFNLDLIIYPLLFYFIYLLYWIYFVFNTLWLRILLRSFFKFLCCEITWSCDPNHGFHRLVQFDLSFFYFFKKWLFLFSSLNIKLLVFYLFCHFFFIRLSSSHIQSHVPIE